MSGAHSAYGALVQSSDQVTPTGRSEAEVGPRLTHRQRVRLQTIEEIKAVARAQILEEGIGGLSLRAVAREIGMPPSGIYRFFASREELLTALRAAAYDAAAQALRDALASAGEPGEHVRRWLCLQRTYRTWGLRNTTDFALVFGLAPDLQATARRADPCAEPGQEAAEGEPQPDPTIAAAERFATELFRPYTEMLADATIDLRRATIQAGATVTDRFAGFVEETGELSPHAIAVALSAWAGLHGWVSLEAFGHLSGLVPDGDPLFEAHALGLLRAVGCDPALLP